MLKMDLEQGLLTRRSCRRFVKNRTIPNKDINDVLKIAMHSPSARDSQSWEFIVIDDKAKFQQIMDVHPYASFLKDASLAIVVCGNLKKQMADGYWVMDTASATNNLLLACHAKGLGSCWCGIYPDTDRMHKFSLLLDLPATIEPLSMVVIGYKSEEPKQPVNRYHVDKIHRNKW